MVVKVYTCLNSGARLVLLKSPRALLLGLPVDLEVSKPLPTGFSPNIIIK